MSRLDNARRASHIVKRAVFCVIGAVTCLALVQPRWLHAQSTTTDDAKPGQFPVFQRSDERVTYRPVVIKKDGQRFHIDLNDQPWAPGERLLRTQIRGIYDETGSVLGIAWFMDGREPVVVSVDLRRFQARLNDLTDEQLRSMNINRNALGSFMNLESRGWKHVFDLGPNGVILLPMGDAAFPAVLRSSGPVLVEYSVTELRHEIEFLDKGVARVWDPIKGMSQLTEREVAALLDSEILTVYEPTPVQNRPVYEAFLRVDGRRVNVELGRQGEKMAAEFLRGWRGPRIRAN